MIVQIIKAGVQFNLAPVFLYFILLSIFIANLFPEKYNKYEKYEKYEKYNLL
ncbi:hypothetical protein J2Z32_002385 [Paenibacillus turicensis]|uniref:Uncharacterized protein n=1 Tax=Paenibacillus turicensis TaxID=160487 RepID=A0ABS4FT32_9BACL|nr:hypothetical protein [Paenibacillus turicensis]